MSDDLPNPWPSFSLDSLHLDDLYLGDASWESVWPVNHREIDPIVLAADFYLLSAITAGFLRTSSPPFVDFSLAEIKASALFLGLPLSAIKQRVEVGRIKVEESYDPMYEIEQQAATMVDDLVNENIDSFINYLEMTTGGELRHHPSLRHNILPPDRRIAWYAWNDIRKTFGDEALEMAIAYFLDFGGGGYGGGRWASSPHLLLQYYTGALGPTYESNRRMFMDRVFTLVHNNGCMLNKLAWANRRPATRTDDNGEYCIYHDLESGMQAVLNAHASDPPNWNTLTAFASEDVVELANRYLMTSE
jgi:hypothetical protein